MSIAFHRLDWPPDNIMFPSGDLQGMGVFFFFNPFPLFSCSFILLCYIGRCGFWILLNCIWLKSVLIGWTVCVYPGASEEGMEEERTKKVESGAITTTWPQLSKDAASAVLYGGVCTGYFTGLVLHGRTKQDLLVLILLMRQL